MSQTSPIPQGQLPPPSGLSPGGNRALWWALGVIVALLILMIAGGLYLASRVIHGITVTGPNQVQVRTPAGNLNVQKSTENDTGLPVYPGATPRNEGARVQFNPSSKQPGVGMVAASYMSSDPLEKVSAWYRQNLDPSFRLKKDQSILQWNSMDVGRADLAYVSEQGDRMRIVALERRGDQTSIGLVRIGRRQAQ